MDNTELTIIREYIIDVILNKDTYYAEDAETVTYLIDVVTSLYNMLHKEVTGEYYDYMFHWANKIGAEIDEHMFKEVTDD